jgi:hypothetical protein
MALLSYLDDGAFLSPHLTEWLTADLVVREGGREGGRSRQQGLAGWLLVDWLAILSAPHQDVWTLCRVQGIGADAVLLQAVCTLLTQLLHTQWYSVLAVWHMRRPGQFVQRGNLSSSTNNRL